MLAPAKINLALEVLGDLPGGYHELDSLFATLDLADELHWRDAPVTNLRLGGEVTGLDISVGEDNLVIRALRALEQASGRPLPLEIELFKGIPAGGGLGGGSADAAALLYGVNQSHSLGFSLEQLEKLAAPLGADVAFSVRGGLARGTGRGDRLQPLPALPARSLVLILPPFFCPTGAVYRAWDTARWRPAAGKVAASLPYLGAAQWAPLDIMLGNDLEPAAEQVQPQLAEIRQALRELGPTLLCGSGSTVSCWGGNLEQVQAAVEPWKCRCVAAQVTCVSRL
ncbi:MAG: 4-(cytidine 5'-diphospho)-2-C-methyl-D-erythritol kinase [Candidatus Eremiobacteraeota bacterium]|nr:4-(cytidine 5'-diphospho)-2-C-methyl-D-erythritol kinase [Candidatus Eremiobacteraeota bacterium]MCW5870151.1 4-(cytidine 5'-diphospho)-2-C-methyl-D-erythritol kinase [Candidatus Eremiobacteraeota bacterium]